MDNEPQSDQPAPTRDWTSYHEQVNQSVNVDAMAALVRRVGGELSKIDSQSVSGSTQRAERIDKQKLIKDLGNKQPVAQQPSSAPRAVPQNAQPTQPIQHIPKPLNLTSTVQTTETTQPHVVELQKRIERLESATRTFRKLKKIKRGAAYKISSNSMKGVVKDASLVAEFVISELAKGVKSITIKLDESTDTQ